jgi:hypothetical protein
MKQTAKMKSITQTSNNKDPKQTIGFLKYIAVKCFAVGHVCICGPTYTFLSHKRPPHTPTIIVGRVNFTYTAHTTDHKNRCEITWHRITSRIPCTALYTKIYILVTTQPATNDNALSLFSPIRIPTETYKCNTKEALI